MGQRDTPALRAFGTQIEFLTAIGQAEIESPRGLAFDEQGRLHVLSGSSLVRFEATTAWRDSTATRWFESPANAGTPCNQDEGSGPV